MPKLDDFEKDILESVENDSKVEYTYKHDGKYMIFHNVPAIV